jgi:hypothetical protein
MHLFVLGLGYIILLHVCKYYIEKKQHSFLFITSLGLVHFATTKYLNKESSEMLYLTGQAAISVIFAVRM